MTNKVEDLRGYLFEELHLLRKGKSSPQQAKAAAILSGKIIDTVKIEIAYNKTAKNKESIKFLKNKDSQKGIPKQLEHNSKKK